MPDMSANQRSNEENFPPLAKETIARRRNEMRLQIEQLDIAADILDGRSKIALDNAAATFELAGKFALSHRLFERAEKAFSDSLRIVPGNVTSHICRAVARQQLGEVSGACEDLRVVLPIVNDDLKPVLEKWLTELEERLGA